MITLHGSKKLSVFGRYRSGLFSTAGRVVSFFLKLLYINVQGILLHFLVHRSGGPSPGL